MSLSIHAVVAMLVVSFASVASAAELVLKPTELILVDGRKVQGQLACELEDRLVLYSPNLGTLGSFRKEFVASYTNGWQTVKLSEPRALTPEELNIKLDWKGWPDAAPSQGPKPAYTTQKWGAPKRLLVWNTLKQQPKTGKKLVSGQHVIECVLGNGKDAANWLVFGAPPEAANTVDMDEAELAWHYPDGPQSLPPELT